MKYREQQIRNILKQHQNKWDQERQTLQQDIYQLENSTDLKLLNQTQDKQKELQEALDKVIEVLGKEEIKNLTDLRNLLKGQTLPELITSWEKKYQTLGETNTLYHQKINDLDNQLINLARQKIKGKKEASELLNQLEANWKTEKERWEKRETSLNRTIESNRPKESDIELRCFVEENWRYIYDSKEDKVNDTTTLFSSRLNSKLTFQRNSLSPQYRVMIDLIIKLFDDNQSQSKLFESNQKKDKEDWKQEKANLITNHQQAQDKQAQSLAQERKEFNEKISQLDKAKEELSKLQKDHSKLIEKYNDLEKRSRLNSLDLNNLTREKQIWLEEKKELKKEVFTPLEKELLEALGEIVVPNMESTPEEKKQFVEELETALNKFDLNETEDYPHLFFNKKSDEKKNFFKWHYLPGIMCEFFKQIDENDELEDEKWKLKNQLEKINLLFDENAEEYGEVDFDELYSLLEKIKQERGGEQNNPNLKEEN